MSIQDHLMTYEEYRQTEQDFPYSFELEKNGQYLFYFGAEHIFDPNDKQVTEIEEFWKKFIEKTKGNNALVLVEGGTRKAEETKEKSMKRDGEGGLVAYLAKQSGIPVESPEPPLSYEVTELLKQFSPEEIFYDYFARTAAQWKRTGTSEDILTYAKQLNAREIQALELPEDILPIISQAHEKIFGNKLDLNDLEHFEKASDPVNISSVANQVARANSILRDIYILQEIEKKWNEGKNLFIIYGATHAIMQEPALRALAK